MGARVLLIGAAVTAIAACVSDLYSRRIPNALTFGGAVVGLLVHAIEGGVTGTLAGMGGWLVGMLLFLPFFAIRGLGGGDVKLLGALGAWLGPSLVVWTALFGAIAGGVLALVVAVWTGYLAKAYANLWLLLAHWRVAGVSAVRGMTLEDTQSPKLAYAVPLTCGLWVAIWLKA